MAVLHYYAGPAAVTFTPRSTADGSLQTAQATVIGINEASVPVITQPRFGDIASDDWAGPDGAPADSQFLGAIAVVQLRLTKFEIAAVDRLMDGVAHYTGGWSTAGALMPFGSFVRQGGLMGQLVLNSASATYTDTSKTDAKVLTLPYVFIRNGGAVNQGTAAAAYDFQFEAWVNDPINRVLYTVTYTTPS